MKKKVLLTGISGYIANHCAVELLKNGYAVRGSLRSLSKSEEVIKAIQNEVDSLDDLEFCKLNLLEDEGWDKAMNGCEYVLHVASPYITTEPKDPNTLIRPAVDGTMRALKAAKKSGVKRIVITSSVVSMLGDADKSININENTWSNVDARNLSSYAKSKTLAEKSAWEFIKSQEDQKLELTVINPGPVFGPSLNGNTDGESMKMFKEMLDGKMPMLPQTSINMSDVRDIAKIHVLALENPNASGRRFIVTTEIPYKFKDIAQILKDDGYKKVSTKEAPNLFLNFMSYFVSDIRGMRAFIGKTYTADVSATKKVFNWQPISLKKSILDTAKSIESFLD
jgi:dihydroflavonol-4-reductase